MTIGSINSQIARSRDEADQPSFSARAFEPLTGMLFLEAGLEPGMNVLDAFSGAGDVAFLAREIVGPDGHVTGFDQSSATVAYANERAAFRGIGNIKFLEADIENLPFGREFDAVIGRAVLMYRHDPVADLRSLVGCLRPEGLAVFQEFDQLSGKTIPPARVVDEVREWLLSVFEKAGIELEMGPRLYSAFKAAGLNPPQMRVDGFIGGAESLSPALIANVVRTLLPQLEALGIARAEDVDIDTLENRMRADLERTGGVMRTPLLIGAWSSLQD
ncbi:MAG TPA: class I SAM-dependent methyltransferase [Sphingomicrobium sp.]|nr:class I SAM-dependent methyltransferase [Sphingomicrobium sp.]